MDRQHHAYVLIVRLQNNPCKCQKANVFHQRKKTFDLLVLYGVPELLGPDHGHDAQDKVGEPKHKDRCNVAPNGQSFSAADKWPDKRYHPSKDARDLLLVMLFAIVWLRRKVCVSPAPVHELEADTKYASQDCCDQHVWLQLLHRHFLDVKAEGAAFRRLFLTFLGAFCWLALESHGQLGGAILIQQLGCLIGMCCCILQGLLQL
mmetsp:Transcript_18165/g.31884  ORF Transcript_18165/g.31884 Transcript_18165/m.31884 type:complete len:205 (+) Transcript_18165:1469-2083(+)